MIHQLSKHMILSLCRILPPNLVAEHRGLELRSTAATHRVVSVVIRLHDILICDLYTTIRQVFLDDCSLDSIRECQIAR